MKLYNSLTQKKEEFKPFKKNEVKIYVCGITPYDTTHLGHVFTYLVFDVLIRYLRFKGYKVIYVQNVTDIDDDLLKKAKEVGKDWIELGNYWTKKFLEDLQSLNIKRPTHYVKATNSITIMIQIIKVLLDKNFAYEKNGNVYFNVKKFKDYGKLSRYNEQQMLIISKERGADLHDPLKINPLDFLLWQKAQPAVDQPLAEKNNPSWSSPWSNGRPGWHLECSSMIKQYLGDQIDLHGGGRDLIYPHHESEMAQSESFSGKKPFVKYWIHTAMMMYKSEKMAKSLGNLVMVSDLLKKYNANEIRMMLLTHHYRLPWEFTEEQMIIAKKNFKTIKTALDSKKIPIKPLIVENSMMKQFTRLMSDDLNSPVAIELLVSLAKKIIRNNHRKQKITLQKSLASCLSILGFIN